MLDVACISRFHEFDRFIELQVFHAERVEVKNKVYHKRCACCFNCTKPLSSRDLCEGKDGNIYCTSCYSRKFGAPGYRGEF